MTDDIQAPAPPANATEASARLETLTADKSWGEKLLAGNAETTKEFHTLTAMVSEGGDDVARAISGALPDMPDSGLKVMAGTAAMLKEIGIEDGAIRQTLEGRPVTQAEHDAAKIWRDQHMRDHEFTKKWLNGDVEASKQMMLASLILSSSIKTEAAA